MNLTQRYATERGIRFPQHEIAGVGANVLRENSRQPMGGEILGGYEVQGGGYFEPREPADIGDLAQAALRQHAADEARGALVARHILAALGESRGMQPLPHDNGTNIEPGRTGIGGDGGPEVAAAAAGSGVRVTPPAGDLSGAGIPARRPTAAMSAPAASKPAQDRSSADLSRLAAAPAPLLQPAQRRRRVLGDLAGIGVRVLPRRPAAGIAPSGANLVSPPR